MEEKFHDFNELNVTKICAGMKEAGQSFSTTKFKEIELQESSTLLSIFKTGNYISTNIGRSVWLGLVSNSVLQGNCNKEDLMLTKVVLERDLGQYEIMKTIVIRLIQSWDLVWEEISVVQVFQFHVVHLLGAITLIR